jgi:hypothetical protein
MPRTVSFEVPVDTSLFTPLQLHPRAALALAFTGLAHWLRSHLVAFPRLVGEWRSGVVFLGFDLRYGAPLRFLDAEGLEVEAGMKALRDSRMLGLEVRLGPAVRPAANVWLLLHPVRVVEPESLAAEPAALPEALVARFREDEWGERPPRFVPGQVAELERSGRLLGETVAPFVVHRHLCEVADQWYFAEIPRLLEVAREQLALRQEAGALRRLMGQPLRRLVGELYHPFYWLQEGEVRSRAYGWGEQLVVVHRLESQHPVKETCGVALEYFPA